MKMLLMIIISIALYCLLRLIFYLVEGIIGGKFYIITLCLYFIVAFGFVYGVYWYFEEYREVIIIASSILILSRSYWLFTMFKKLHDPIKAPMDLTLKTGVNEQADIDYSSKSSTSALLKHSACTLSFGLGIVISWIIYFID